MTDESGIGSFGSPQVLPPTARILQSVGQVGVGVGSDDGEGWDKLFTMELVLSHVKIHSDKEPETIELVLNVEAAAEVAHLIIEALHHMTHLPAGPEAEGV